MNCECCGKDAKFKCSGCGDTGYCSEKCQAAHFDEHVMSCGDMEQDPELELKMALYIYSMLKDQYDDNELDELQQQMFIMAMMTISKEVLAFNQGNDELYTHQGAYIERKGGKSKKKKGKGSMPKLSDEFLVGVYKNPYQKEQRAERLAKRITKYNELILLLKAISKAFGLKTKAVMKTAILDKQNTLKLYQEHYNYAIKKGFFPKDKQPQIEEVKNTYDFTFDKKDKDGKVVSKRDRAIQVITNELVKKFAEKTGIAFYLLHKKLIDGK